MKTIKKLNIHPTLLIINLAIVVSVIWALFSLGNTSSITVSALAVNVRTGPSIEYEVSAQAKQGDKLTVIKEENQWYEVRLNNQETGWVASWLVSQNDASATTNLSAKVTEDKLPLHAEPNDDSETLATLKAGAKVNITEEKDGWSQISTGKKEGWVTSNSLTLTDQEKQVKDDKTPEQLFARENSTKIRSEPNLNGTIVTTLDYGESITYKGQEGDWYEVITADGSPGYVANWVVSLESLDESKSRQASSIAETTILLDPGHGGDDVGAQSNDKLISEKIVTLATANYVAKELRKLGANVVYTRDDDSYVYLEDVVAKSNQIRADAFISFHYDSTEVSNQATGFTTYYYADDDLELAETVNKHLGEQLPLTNRGVEVGDYLVIRENERPALLLELGYMNNDSDAQTFKTKKFQRQVAAAIRDSLVEYFGK